MPDDIQQPNRETLPPPASCDPVTNGDVPADAPQANRETLPPPAVVDPAFGAVNGDTAIDEQPEAQPDPSPAVDAGQPSQETGQ